MSLSELVNNSHISSIVPKSTDSFHIYPLKRQGHKPDLNSLLQGVQNHVLTGTKNYPRLLALFRKCHFFHSRFKVIKFIVDLP